MRVCNYCGKENDDTATHCVECGTELAQAAVTSASVTPPPSPPPAAVETPVEATEPAAFLWVFSEQFDLDGFLDRWPEWKRIPSAFFRKGEPIPESDEVSKTTGFQVDLVAAEAQVWEQVNVLRSFVLKHYDVLAWLRESQPVIMMARLTMSRGAESSILELSAPLLGLFSGIGLKLDILSPAPPPKPAPESSKRI